MPQGDAQKWNQRYRKTGHNLSRPRDFLLENADLLPDHGWGLDVAMGLGHNAEILVQHGLQVIGIDISRVALRKAKVMLPEVNAVQVDLPDFGLKSGRVDVVLNFWFLERRLYPFFREVIKPGGLLFFETMREDPNAREQTENPDYLLKTGELPDVFQDWDIILYDENVAARAQGQDRSAARLIARKPIGYD